MKYKAKKVKGKRIDEHRLIMEKHLGIKLTNEEIIHHIDGDKSNNKIENLELFPNKKSHTKFHHENGDLKLNSGNNRKRLVDGKLKCGHCEELKDLTLFVTSKRNHLGVLGTCKKCYSIQRKKYIKRD